MPDEARAKTFFGNDMTGEQWAEHWKTMVPQPKACGKARLNGYPDRVPITHVSMADNVGCPHRWPRR
jgi:hypothetical protein